MYNSMNIITVVLIFALLSLCCECKIEPYKVLGVARRASSQEIRKAYKNLAKEWHPDKNDNPNAQTKFVEINAAYEILNDPERRKRYDNHGVVDDQDRRGSHPENFRHHFRSFHSPFDSFFEHDFFSGGSGGRGESIFLIIEYSMIKRVNQYAFHHRGKSLLEMWGITFLPD